MKPDDFDLFVTLLKQRSGFTLTRDKSYLLESRLVPVLRKWNLKSLEDMAQAVRERRDEIMMSDITEAMMIGDTYFFRDRRPFQSFVTTLLPQLMAARASKKHLRIWSAACSTGQEAYSLAMLCAEQGDKLADWRVDIVGTDLSREAVLRANSGNYSQLEIQRGLPSTLLVKYFLENGDHWRIDDAIRQHVEFHAGNLLMDFSAHGVFDIIFCRNVLSDFDNPTQQHVVERLCNSLALDGYLVLGKGETVAGVSERFATIPNNSGDILSMTRKAA